MRKALFTNGSGIKTLASAGVGCVGLQFNSGTRALTLSRAAPKGLETKFSYDGWHHDADEAEKYYVRFGDAFSDIGLGAMLDSMRRKQQLHSGDRSHPFIRKLDALTPTLSYDGWEKDARIIEWPGAGDGIFEGLSMDESDVDKLLARMRRKQAECDGDRSNKGLRELKELKAVLSYDGWHHDADEAEKYYVRFGDAFSDIGLGAMLDSMRRKQQLHSGDRSHPFIRKLDALTPTLSYDGWEKDARIIEWPGAGDGIFEGLSMDESDVDKLLARMRRKQAECDGDRSNKDLRELA